MNVTITCLLSYEDNLLVLDVLRMRSAFSALKSSTDGRIEGRSREGLCFVRSLPRCAAWLYTFRRVAFFWS